MIFTNFSLENDSKMEYTNGATRTNLVVINKTGSDIERNVPFQGKIGTLKKGKHFFVFLNKGFDKRNLFVFLDGAYGCSFHFKKPIEMDISIGGYGNSESTLAILGEGTLIECHSYKFRRGSDFIRTTSNGFEDVDSDEAELLLAPDDVVEI